MVLQGQNLFQHVAKTSNDSFWWLGQHSFIVKLRDVVILIDPFLSPIPERLVPPLFEPGDASVVSLVCCTHDHLDHLDPVAVSGLAEATSAKFVAPRAHRDRLRSLNVNDDRLLLLDDLEMVEHAGVKITGIKAAHEDFDCTPQGLHPFLGFVFEGGGKKSGGKVVYHAGDTVWWEGLQARLAHWDLDVAMVPINGRDAVRLGQGIIGNMTYQEAADLLGGVNVALTVPTHYDMFEFNSVDVQLFADYMKVKYPSRRIWIGQPTERISF